MSSAKLRISALLFSLFLIGCTPPAYDCPQINCPQNEETINSALLNKTAQDRTILTINAGTEINLEVIDGYMDITNCGKTVYGPIAVDEIKGASNNYTIRNLIINNTESNYIGGCRDILIEFPEIEIVYIMDIARDTIEYNELIRWTPPNKLR